ncbi:MAG TPA: gamma-glutamyltransferase family protein [Candidatus Dormibacteraeota bacterium]|nr:gamma-glutamyltransferase family protein [Candidatus Dormibacteraeota bacterium]
MTKGVIATPHHVASEVGAQILREGGNAIDAAIAADAVLCVVYPHMTSVAGDLMALVWAAGESSPVGLIGAGRSGELATIDAVRERGFEEMPARGALSVTVPGTVEAWGRLLERFGSVGLGAVLEPAAALAHDGYVITAHLSDALKKSADVLGHERAAYALYPPMEAGMLLRNQDLASTLRELARNGINGFYRGQIAGAIADAIKKRDGFMTRQDLAMHRSQWVEPVVFPYRDTMVYELPPPTVGLVAAAMALRLLSGQDFRAARDASYALRDAYITDPDFTPAPFQPFLDPAAAIDRIADTTARAGDTCYLCAADEQGNLVSMIQSVAYDFGSGVVAEGTGMLLQNRGAYFSLDPRHVNRLEPKKRTMHTLIPAMAAREGAPWAAFGTMGGPRQPQLQVQVLRNLVDEGMDPAEAVARPRRMVLDDGVTMAVEADYPGAGEMARSDPRVMLMPPRHHSFGHAHAIVVDGPGKWRAGSDPRSDGSVEHTR